MNLPPLTPPRLSKWDSLCLFLSLAVFAFCTVFQVPNIVDRKLQEWRFQADTWAPSGNIVLVDIDAESLAVHDTWPWPRSLHADLVETIDAAGADEIAFDIDFSSRSTPAEDARLATAIENANASIILGAFVQQSSTNADVYIASEPLEIFSENAWPAVVNVLPDSDNLVRKFPNLINVDGIPTESLPTVIAGTTTQSNEATVLDLGVDVQQFPRLSFHQVLSGDFSPNFFEDKKIIVGASAIELQDYFNIPIHGFVSGHTVQAIAAETLIAERNFQPTNQATTIAIFALAGVLFAFALLGTPFAYLFIASVAVLIGCEFFARYMHTQHHEVVALGTLVILIANAWLYAAMHMMNIKSVLITILEKRNKNSETIVTSIIEDNFDGIILVDQDLNPMVASRMAANILEVRDHSKSIVEYLPRRLLNDIKVALASPSFQTTQDGEDQSETRAREVTMDTASGRQKHLEYTLTASSFIDEQTDKEKRVVYVYFKDISAKKEADAKIHHLANHHPVTGLPNRLALRSFLENALKSQLNSDICVISLSIKQLDVLTAATGYSFVLDTLRSVTNRLKENCDQAQFISNFGENRFAIVVNGQEESQDLAVDLLECLSRPYSVSDTRVNVEMFCGISSSVSSDTNDCDTLINQSITALQKANDSHLKVPCWYEREHEKEIQTRRELEIELIHAIKKDELEIVYQPQFDLSTGELIGSEALIRWNNKLRGPVSPDVFIPIAEQTGFIEQIGEWVCEKVAKDVATWPKHLTTAINASAAQFKNGDLHTKLSRLVERHGLSPSQIDIEITETLFIGDPESVIDQLKKIREAGFSVALDDFGTGYSSLSYIQNFPLDKIKIDQAFTRNSEDNDKARIIIEMVSLLAKGFGMKTVLEGIESQAHWDIGHKIGANVGQGYFYSRPLPFDSMTEFIAEKSASETSPEIARA